jgi:hypothetical protein
MSENKKMGEVSWTDTVVDSSASNGKDSFLRLIPGTNIVRVLTAPFQYYQHKMTYPGGKKYGYRVTCAGEGCPLCKDGDKAKIRWFIGVIDRKENRFKILDIGKSIFKDIQTHASDSDWGDPSRYDMDIVVDPNGGATNYYSVVCKPPRPLSAGDLVMQEENAEVLPRRATPPSPEKVQERVDSIMEEISFSNAGSVPEAETPLTNGSSEAEDFKFKNYDAPTKKTATVF